MAQEAVFVRGDPFFMEYTPGAGAVSAGQVVVLGNTTGLGCGVAHQDIANNVQGVLAVKDGRYYCSASGNVAQWAKVYWDDANNKVTTTSTNNAQFGYALETGNNVVIECLHMPTQ